MTSEIQGRRWRFTFEVRAQTSCVTHKFRLNITSLKTQSGFSTSGFLTSGISTSGCGCRDWKRLTLDVIASTVFSYDTDVFNEQDNIFLNKLIELFRQFDLTQTSVLTIAKIMFGSESAGGDTRQVGRGQHATGRQGATRNESAGGDTRRVGRGRHVTSQQGATRDGSAGGDT